MGLLINLPSHLDTPNHDLKTMIAGKLFEEGILSSRQAADVVGISKREFIETIGKYGFSLFQNTEEQPLEDINRA